MKKILALAIATALSSVSFAARDHNVRGHTKKDGTYVAPHRKTDPDKRKDNNYSSKGNENPYTGKKGTKDPNK